MAGDGLGAAPKAPILEDNEDLGEVCWVCLDSDGKLVKPCKCPRYCHPKCLARWQLQSAGKPEERHCRFCLQQLPDWKKALTPAHLKPSTPVVSVHYNGACYRLRVKPGTEGYEQFKRQLHRITGMPMLECMQITFQCKSPDTAQELSFKGITAFDAAIHCAAVSAAERLTQTRRSSSADSAAAGTTTSSGTEPAQGAGTADPGSTGSAGNAPTLSMPARASSASPLSRQGANSDARADAHALNGSGGTMGGLKGSLKGRMRDFIWRLFAVSA